MTLLEQVRKDPPHWANDVIQPYPYGSQAEIEKYTTSYYWCDSDSVNVHDVVGTAHPDYADRSWLNLLENGKRMKNINLPLLVENPGYYHETVKKSPEMQYTTVDGKTYIHLEGNHRTCIARFFFHYQGLTTLHGITTEEYTVNHEFKKAHMILDDIILAKSVSWRTDVERTRLSRNDTAGWMREEYDLKLLVKSRAGSLLLNLDELYELILDSQRPFRKFYGKYKKLWRE